MTGKVIFFDVKKGYGFIRRDDTDERLFVHRSELVSEDYKFLVEGQKVWFEIGTDPYKKNPMATHVKANFPQLKQTEEVNGSICIR